MTGFSKEMQDALREDAAKLSAITGEEHTVEFFYTEDIASYPLGITLTDHIAHDMRVGRFPEQSTIYEFLKEVAIESDAAILRRVMNEPTMGATVRASRNATRLRNAVKAARNPQTGLTPTEQAQWYEHRIKELEDRVAHDALMLERVCTQRDEACAEAGQLSTKYTDLLLGAHRVLAWVPEDELPDSLPSAAFDALYPYSNVDGIRWFPIFGPKVAGGDNG
jgi:hypothetical protein